MSGANDTVVAINAGSSSVKFALYAVGQQPQRLLSGQIEGLGVAEVFSARDAAGAVLAQRKFDESAKPLHTHEAALDYILRWIDTQSSAVLAAAGHRVVHGGDLFAAPVKVDAAVLAELDKLVPLAPLHQPHNLAAIRAVSALRPGLPQVACFDTAFHVAQPRLAKLFALPRALTDQGIKRYGFHGLSYEYINSILPKYLGPAATGRVIVAHLGNGASLCAIRDGTSAATSMGFSTCDGLMMGTRSGNLDPGVLIYLLRQGYDVERIERLLYRESGLLGVSALSSDLRDLLASPDAHAREAVDLFVYRIVREIGSLTAVLGGLDSLIFTAGIGEHAAPVRRAICEQLSWLGLTLDAAANENAGPCITQAGSRVSAWVIPTDEELVIVRHTLGAIGRRPQV
jgi:acetate kinase